MDYEKNYKDALERASKLRVQNPFDTVDQMMEYIFPELKEESDDEKIRKAIIESLPKYGYLPQTSIKVEDAIAWLEKQGEQKHVIEMKTPEESLGISSEEYNKIVDECIYGNDKSTWGKEDEQILNAAILHIKNETYNYYGGYSSEDIMQWLKSLKGRIQPQQKQGEQKPTDNVEPKFKIGDTVTVKPMSCHGKVFKGKPFKIVDIIKDNYVSDDGKTYSISLQDGWELVEQKPDDKAEPKFHEGEWVVNKFGDAWHIDSFDNKNYQVSNGDKYCYFPIEKQNEMHLWTIQDAKDGDVLFTSSTASHETFIFKSIDENGNAECYFAYDSEDGFREGKYHFIGSAINCKPATKKQYDTLMKVMTDKGYTFDFKKKELKKIEQKPAWSEEDEKTIDEAVEYLENYAEYVQGGFSKQHVLDIARRIESICPPQKQKVE